MLPVGKISTLWFPRCFEVTLRIGLQNLVLVGNGLCLGLMKAVGGVGYRIPIPN